MKKYVILLVLVLTIIVTFFGYGSVVSEAKVKSIYSSSDNVTLEGKLKKVKYYYAGEWQTNYVLYTHHKFTVEFSQCFDISKQNRICLYITKKQFKKYRNKKIRVKGTMTENSGYYCTSYGLHNIKKIKKIKKWSK